MSAGPGRHPALVEERLRCDAGRIDVAIAQRPRDLALIEEWTGRRPGSQLPTVYVEHNTP